MKCPYCNGEMEEGKVTSKTVPQWLKSGEKKGQFLSCEKHFMYNALLAHRCAKCKKIIIEDNGIFRL